MYDLACTRRIDATKAKKAAQLEADIWEREAKASLFAGAGRSEQTSSTIVSVSNPAIEF